MPSWLSTLPSHPIFDLPPLASTDLNGASELARPATPPLDISVIHGTTETPSRSGTMSQSSSSRSLFGLSTHGGGTPRRSQPTRSRALASTATSTSTDFPSKSPEVGGLGRKNKLVVVKGRDLIVAVGSELRIAGLAEVKQQCLQRQSDQESERGEWEKEVKLGDYKTLNTPLIKFDIQQLVLNSTGKLLAVIGAHSVAVVVLPRKGWSSSVGKGLECRSLLVGRYYHALSGSPLVSQVLWHPWGDNASSLLVLTVDSIVREYDISTDVEEPAQMISFVEQHNTPRKFSGGFSAEDENARRAVAMCVGDGKADWGPLTLCTLMRNGDVVAMCPFLPRKASVPASFIHALSCFVSTKVDYLDLNPIDDSLAVSRSTPTRSTPASTPQLSSLYARQLQYVNQLVRQVNRSHERPALLSEGMDVDLPSVDEDPSDRNVSIIAPRGATPKLQGPFLMQPAPIELDHIVDASATDLFYLHYEPQGDESNNEAGIGVFGIAYQDGKVDLCLEVEKVEARWNHDREGEEGENDLPSLCVYETIDLGLVQELGGEHAEEEIVLRMLDGGWVTFVQDPLYVDTIYVQHSLGAHCLVLSKWLDNIVDALNPSSRSDEEDEEKFAHEMEKAVRSSGSTDVVWIVKTLSPSSDISAVPIVGVDLINDVYLGYSILLVTSSLQLVGIELSLRVDSTLLASTSLTQSTQHGLSSEPPPYLSLLEQPFEIPPVLSSSQKSLTVPRQVIPKPLANQGALETVTPESLRFVGKSVETFRTSLRDLVSASDEVQNRLELQLKELSRQLSKIDELRKMTVSTPGDDSVRTRVEEAKARQEKLLRRTDRVLQALMDRHAPEVSTFERKWFDELGRLEKEIVGKPGQGDGLHARVERVREKVEALRPGLEEMKRKELEANGVKDKERTVGSTLGETQLRKVEEKLADEANLIAEARRKVERLTQALGTTSLS